MIESKLGIIAGLKVTTLNGTADDGSKIKIPVQEFKIETSDIDYEIIEEYFPEVYQHLKLEKNTMDAAKFRSKKYNLDLEFNRLPGVEDSKKDMVKYKYEHINLIQTQVNYKEDIPTFTFVFQKNIEKSDFYLSNASGVTVQFTLNYHPETSE